MRIGRAHADGARDPVGIGHQVVLRSVLPAVRRVRPDRSAPLLARMFEASTATTRRAAATTTEVAWHRWDILRERILGLAERRISFPR